MKKLVLIIILAFSSLSLFAGVSEEQRKYVFDKPSAKFDQFVKEGLINGLKSTYHSKYQYYDIYLDTDDKSLYNNNLSLRLRKRDFGDGTFEYGIQLKSEMINHGDIRMEIEEDDISFYNIVFNGQTFKLQSVLDQFYDRFLVLTNDAQNNASISNDPVLLSLLEKINTWIQFKLGSNIEPFIKLNKMKIEKDDLKSLKPVIIGKSIRSRSHITLEKNNEWVMETSFDRARFYSLLGNNNAHDIREYEVENKSKNPDQGREYMDLFENGIIQKFGAQINLESKYKQVIKSYLENE